jgi:sporulation protein YlmC with PRC-barrel domain
MRNARQIGPTIAVAGLIAAAAGWMVVRAQDAPMSDTGQKQQLNQSGQQGSMTGQPLSINKCSELIGSRVENLQGDKLGKIDNVVVDFDSGRVSYCVLAVSRGIFRSSKYLAVPISAFKPSADGSYLILNADKDRVAQASGFDRDSWPSVSNPAWGAEPFWDTSAPSTTMPSTPENIPLNTPQNSTGDTNTNTPKSMPDEPGSQE